MKDLFITLLNMSISATWLIFAVVLVRLCLGKAPKWIRGVLWGMVALRLVVPFALESPISLVPDLQISVEAPERLETPSVEATEDVKNTEQAVTPPVVDMPVVTPSENSPVVDIPSPDILPTTPGVTVGEILLPDEPIKEPDIQTPVITPDEEPEPNTEDKKGVDIAFIVAVIWCIGTLAMAVYCLGSYWRLKLKLREAVLVEDGVYESDRTKSAFVLGIIKPRIYLPRTLPAEDREYVIAHERVHIGRFDHILKPLGFLILALHWYNPTVWLAYILFCRDTELACDEKVIKGYNVEQIKGYSRALVACGEGHSRILVCPIAFGEVGIKERVKNILNYKKPAFWIVVGAVALCIIVAVCFMTVRGDKGTGAYADPTEQTETDGTEATDGTEESDNPTESTEPTSESTEDPTEEPTEGPTEEPTERPTDDPDESTEKPTDEPTEPSSDPTAEPVEPIDLKIIGTNSRPAGAKDIKEEPELLFSAYGLLPECFEEVTVHVANSVDSTQWYGICVLDSYDELSGLIEAINEGKPYNKVELPDYGEKFFRENILVVSYWDKPDQVSVGGGELCLEYNRKMHIDGYGVAYPDVVYPPNYYGVAVSREKLDGVDTLSILSKHIYSDLPEQVPALPKEYTVSKINSSVTGKKGEFAVSDNYYFRNWGFNPDSSGYLSVEYSGIKEGISFFVYDEEFWYKWYLSSGNHTYERDVTLPEVFTKYDSAFFSEKVLIILRVPGKPYEYEVAFDGKKNDKLYFTVNMYKGVFTEEYYYGCWSFVEIDRSLFEGVNELVVCPKISNQNFWDYSSDPDGPDDCSYGMHDMEYTMGKCGLTVACSRCHLVDYESDRHKWSDDSDSATCTVCGMQRGESHVHVYTDATCATPATCKECGATKGKALGHNYSEPTCTRPATCMRCGAKKNNDLKEHVYNDATCVRPAYCKYCGKSYGDTDGTNHSYADATCTKPATCKLCGVTKGEPLGHGAMSFATCTHNGKCLVCGAVTEAALGHKFVNNICIRSCCDSVRKNKDPSVKYVYRDSAEDLVIDILDGAISFYGSFDIIDGRVKITCKMKECDDLILWDRSLVKCYVNGVLTDKGNAVSFGAKKDGDEWDECTFYIPYTEDGEYLISLRYGDPTMPYTVTVSFPVLTMIQMM